MLVPVADADEQLLAVPLAGVLPSLPSQPPPLNSEEVQDIVRHAIRSGEITSRYLRQTDAHLIFKHEEVPEPVQRLLNIRDRLEACRSTPDLIHQLYINERSGTISPAPFHAHGHLQRVPLWYNYGKGGGVSLSFDYQLLALVLNQSGVGTAEDFHELTFLIHRFEVVDRVYEEEGKRQHSNTSKLGVFSEDSKQKVVREAERLELCFSADATETMEEDDLNLSRPFSRPDIRDALAKFEQGFQDDVRDVAAVATAERLNWLLIVLNELE